MADRMHRCTTARPGTEKILLVDDDSQFREALAIRLRRDGYDCACAADATGALALLLASDFDVFISDICMPGNMGLDLVERVPQLKAGLPVILLTGFPTVESAVKSVNLSVAGYIVKPPDMDHLRSLLTKAVAAVAPIGVQALFGEPRPAAVPPRTRSGLERWSRTCILSAWQTNPCSTSIYPAYRK